MNIFRRQSQAKDSYWDITDRVLLEIQKLCAASGVELKILVIPDRYQVDPLYWDAWVKKYHLAADDFDLEAPSKHLLGFAQKHGIQLIDPLLALRAAHEKGLQVYWSKDTHLSAQGHAIINDLLVSQTGVV